MALSNWNLLIVTPNWFFTMLWKFGRIKLISDLCLSKKNQDTLVQSLMKDTNQSAPDILGIGERPQISLWIRWKGSKLPLLFVGKGECLCLASSHTSPWKLSTSNLLNREGNKNLRVWNDGCPILWWWSQIFSLFKIWC